MKKIIVYTIVAILNFIMFINVLIAQEYKIGSEDRLAITFWQQPDLNSEVLVSQNGTIILPVIGKITAAGLTPSILATKIVNKISLFNRNISQASVVVTQYGSKKIYVTGHVMSPGKYAFEVMPNLWEIILEAGGPAETAILNQVQIIRGGANSGRIETVDLTAFLGQGDKSVLPSIYPGDTIKISGLRRDVNGAEAQVPGGITSTQVDDDVVYIYGQVIRPGGYQFTKNLSLLEAIIVAGGPTQLAKLDEVRIIMKGAPYSSVATVNLKRYANKGTPAPFMLNPGDTIYIPEKKQSVFQALQRGLLYDVLRIVLTAGTSVLIYNLAL